MTDLLVALGLAFLAFIGGGITMKARAVKRKKLDRLENERKANEAKQRAQDAFADSPDAARDWLRDS